MWKGFQIFGWTILLFTEVCTSDTGNFEQNNFRFKNRNTYPTKNIYGANFNPESRNVQYRHYAKPSSLNTGAPEYLPEGRLQENAANLASENSRLKDYAAFNAKVALQHHRKQNSAIQNSEIQDSTTKNPATKLVNPREFLLHFSDDKYNEVQADNPETVEEFGISTPETPELVDIPEPIQFEQPALNRQPSISENVGFAEDRKANRNSYKAWNRQITRDSQESRDDQLTDDQKTEDSFETESTSTLSDLIRKTRQGTPDPYDGSFETGPDDHRPNMGELPEDSNDGTEPGPMAIEWCEGNVRRQVLGTECSEITFVPPFPTCYCIEGMASIRLDKTKNCDTSFHFARDGCYNFEALGYGARSIRLEQNFRQSDMVIAVEFKTELKSEWTVYVGDDITDGFLVQMQRNVRILNGELFQSDDGTNCIQRLSSKIVRTYRNVYGTYRVSFGRCRGFAISDSRLVYESPVVDRDFQLCTPNCEKSSDVTTTEDSDLSNPDSIPAFRSGNPDALVHLEPSCKPIPPMLKSLHDDLNTRILRRSIDRSFHSDAEITGNPEKSFNLLSKLAEITHKVCKNGNIPMRFLDTAVDLLKVAHEGRGYYFPDEFAPRDYKFILKALESCLTDVEPLEFKKTDCEDVITDVQNGTQMIPLQLSEEHKYFDHHVVLDVSWNMMDLVNVACIDSFKHSYRSYHILEQGIEKLFTRELRTFWQYPDYPRNFYERVFGMFWHQMATNLEYCVEGSYVVADRKLWRLNRPTWLEGLGLGTRGEKVCKRRLTNEVEKVLSNEYEIYCLPLECS